MKLLCNAFSLGMLDSSPVFTIRVTQVTEDQARQWASVHTWESSVGHADTALLFSALLGVEVTMNRRSTEVHKGDELLIGQYNGPRLPENATSLPEGAKIRWMIVEV